MDQPAPRRPARAPRRGYDLHQTHFFYRDDLAAGVTVVDHVTGQPVGQVDRVGRHVFEGYGAPAAGGGEAGDLVVEVVELEPVEPVRVPWRAPGAVRRNDLDPQGEETLTVDLERSRHDTDGRPDHGRDDHDTDDPDELDHSTPGELGDGEPEDRRPGERPGRPRQVAPEPTQRLDASDAPGAADDPDDPADAPAASARRSPSRGDLAQGAAIVVLAPLVALALLVLLLVLLVG